MTHNAQPDPVETLRIRIAKDFGINPEHFTPDKRIADLKIQNHHGECFESVTNFILSCMLRGHIPTQAFSIPNIPEFTVQDLLNLASTDRNRDF